MNIQIVWVFHARGREGATSISHFASYRLFQINRFLYFVMLKLFTDDNFNITHNPCSLQNCMFFHEVNDQCSLFRLRVQVIADKQISHDMVSRVLPFFKCALPSFLDYTPSGVCFKLGGRWCLFGSLFKPGVY